MLSILKSNYNQCFSSLKSPKQKELGFSNRLPSLKSDQICLSGIQNNSGLSFGTGFGIKVCGMCDEASVESVMSAEYAANTDKLIIGLLIGITHFSKEKLSDDQAANMIKKIRKMSYQLDRPVKIACVNHCTDAQTLIDHMEYISDKALNGKTGLRAAAKKVSDSFGNDTSKLTKPIFDIIQIHDNMPLDEIQKVADKYPHCKIIKCVHIPKKGEVESFNIDDIIANAVALAKNDCIDALLLDSSNVATNQIGGTGLVNDWAVAKKLIAEVHKKTGKPVALAGGLNPDNAKAAIEATGADMVDGNTGWRHDRPGEVWKPLDPAKSAPKDPFAVFWVLQAFKDKVSPFFVRHFDRE